MKVGMLLTCLALSTSTLAGEEPAVRFGDAPTNALATQVLGRWDITISEGKRRVPCWLEIRPDGDKLAARFCSEVRGAYDSGEVKIEGNQVIFKSIDQKDYPNRWYTYRGSVNGTSMFGSRNNGVDPDQTWFAKQFIPKINVTGTWELTDKQGKDAPSGTLRLKQDKEGIGGTFIEAETGRELAVVGASLSGGVLTFEVGEVVKIAGDQGQETVDMFDAVKTFEAKVKGDVLEGTATDTVGTVTTFTAHRQRQWGKPIYLFNGKNLDGWKPLPDPSGHSRENKWSAVDGIMTCAGRSLNIVSEQKFMDFKIHVEFRVPPKGNSGVYLRGRYEIQVADSFGQPVSSSGCGGMYSRITPLVNASKPPNEWQTYDATLVGQYITVKLNDVLIVDNQELEGITGGAIDSHEHLPGPIYLQGDHKKIEYRNIIIYPAQPEPTPKSQSKPAR